MSLMGHHRCVRKKASAVLKPTKTIPRVRASLTTKPYPEFNFRHKFSRGRGSESNWKDLLCPTNFGKQSYHVREAKKFPHSLVLQSMARSLRRLEKIPWEKHPV